MKNRFLVLMTIAGLSLNLQAMYDEMENSTMVSMADPDPMHYKAASKIRTIGDFIRNGLSYYQAEDACIRGMNLQQAQLAAQQGSLETLESKIQKAPYCADVYKKEEKEYTHRCLTVPKFMDAGLSFNRANSASYANFTLEQALLMNKTIIKNSQSRGINYEDNSNLGEIIAAIKRKK